MKGNDLVQRDLKPCHLKSDWHDSVQDCLGWRSEVKMCVEDLNRQAELKEKQCKDLWEKRREKKLELED